MGSKRRIAKEILPIILQNRTEDQWYVEPFCGGCNSLDKVTGNRIGNDINKYLIALLKEMQKDDFTLPFIGEEEYRQMKLNQHAYSDWVLGYAGLQLSFGAKWFGGYRRDKKGVSGNENEMFQNNQAKNSILKQSPLLKNVVFYCVDYNDLSIPQNSIIYCDPPYKGTTEYKDEFDHEKFWKWCKGMVYEGHQVFVSEYNAPSDWIPIWQKEVTTGLDVTSTKKDIERLFTLNKSTIL